MTATASITVDIIMGPIPADDVITLSESQFQTKQEVVLDTLLKNDVDPNTRVSNTLPLRIESASCVLSTVCSIEEDGTQIKFKLRGFEVSRCCFQPQLYVQFCRAFNYLCAATSNVTYCLNT
jgi:hypothetical protein